MYHGVTFKIYANGGESKDIVETCKTFDDWGLIPTERPAIAMPALKTHTIDIPGANGLVDLSEYLTGYPLYENRTGLIEFAVENKYYEGKHGWAFKHFSSWQNTLGSKYDSYTQYYPWAVLYRDLVSRLHGKRGQLILDDDPNWYYEGRFTVDEWKSDEAYSTVQISYDLEPFKKSVQMSNEPWLWDPFDFVEGEILDVYHNLRVPANDHFLIILYNYSGPPVRFTIYVYGSKSEKSYVAFGSTGVDGNISFIPSQFLTNGDNTYKDYIIRPGWENYFNFHNESDSDMFVDIVFRRESL